MNCDTFIGLYFTGERRGFFLRPGHATLRGVAVHASQLLWFATAGSAHSLHLQDHIGSLKAGNDADICVLDLASTPAIAQRTSRATDIWEAVFPTIMMGDDRAIADVWVNGIQVAPTT